MKRYAFAVVFPLLAGCGRHLPPAETQVRPSPPAAAATGGPGPGTAPQVNAAAADFPTNWARQMRASSKVQLLKQPAVQQDLALEPDQKADLDKATAALNWRERNFSLGP